MAQRRKFSEEFKREAVGLTRLPGANRDGRSALEALIQIQ